MTSTILNSEVKCPTGRWWSVPQTRGRRELSRLQASTIRVLARYITLEEQLHWLLIIVAIMSGIVISNDFYEIWNV